MNGSSTLCASCSFASDSRILGQDFLLLFVLKLSLLTSDWIGSPIYGLAPAINDIERVARRRYLQSKTCGVELRGYEKVANACSFQYLPVCEFFFRNLYSYSSYVRCLRNGAVQVTVSRPYCESILNEVADDEFRWFVHAAARNAYYHLRG